MPRIDRTIVESMHAEVRQLLGEADALIHYEQNDTVALKEVLAEYTSAKTLPLLKEIPLERLRSLKSNLPLSLLNTYGYQSVGDILSSNEEKIADIRGISEEGAETIYGYCQSIQKEVASQSHFSLSAEAEQASIRRCLYRFIQHKEASLDAGYAMQRYGMHMEELLEKTEPLKRNAFSYFFTAGHIKRDAEQAFHELTTMLDGEAGDYFEKLQEQEYNLIHTSDETILAHYRQNPAMYEQLLESIDDRFVDYDIVEGGIPKEMAEEISHYELDLSLLKAQLRTYQTFGVQYILAQKNVLLGDEMGLGKTVEAIAAMAHLKAKGAMHLMVVCPAGVLINWQREILQHSYLKPVILHGKFAEELEEWIHFGGVAVTTYDMIRKIEIPENFQMEMLVADEAHYVKNPSAKRTIRLRQLSLQAARTLYMTGTPLENNPDEMCTLVDALQPLVAEELRGRTFILAASTFREKLAPVYLRRRREDVLKELPDIIYNDEWCALYPEEYESYRLSVQDGSFNQMRLVSWATLSTMLSAKAERLVELMASAKQEERKVLIFSWFLEPLQQIHALLEDVVAGMITGSVSGSQRQKIIDDFALAPSGSALLMQVVSGGTGLNIQDASMIIFCEPQIKPSIEQQAISRAYRMGQTRSVTVHRLLAVNTIDEAMCAMLERKQLLFDVFADESVIAQAHETHLQESEWIQSLIKEEQKKLENSLVES